MNCRGLLYRSCTFVYPASQPTNLYTTYLAGYQAAKVREDTDH